MLSANLDRRRPRRLRASTRIPAGGAPALQASRRTQSAFLALVFLAACATAKPTSGPSYEARARALIAEWGVEDVFEPANVPGLVAVRYKNSGSLCVFEPRAHNKLTQLPEIIYVIAHGNAARCESATDAGSVDIQFARYFREEPTLDAAFANWSRQFGTASSVNHTSGVRSASFLASDRNGAPFVRVMVTIRDGWVIGLVARAGSPQAADAMASRAWPHAMPRS